MAETLFQELKRYVQWSTADEQALRSLHALAAPHFTGIARAFYDRLIAHEGAKKVFTGGGAQAERLVVTLVAWMDSMLQGPWDEAYFERRARIGRVHVRIGLPQHYMFGAMNVIRQEMNGIVDQHFVEDPTGLGERRTALGKILDLELAIMLHTYREDLLSQQARTERLSTFGQLVGSIGHELRNPLAVIETSLFLVRTRVGSDEGVLKHVNRIGQQVAIANDIITQLLDMIRDRPLAREPVDVSRVVADSEQAVPRPEAVRVGVELAALPPVLGDAGQLRQVFVNLLQNAVQAVGERGFVRVSGGLVDGRIAVAVEDSGPGVDPEVQNRLFEPLVTTRAKGIGLGLALVKRIVERHGGSIGYEPRQGSGARFVVRLPPA